LEDKKEAQSDGGRRFQREGPATKKDLDLAIVVLVRGTKGSRLSREHRGSYDYTRDKFLILKISTCSVCTIIKKLMRWPDFLSHA